MPGLLLWRRSPSDAARSHVSIDVLVIGAGPAGLAAATRLRQLGVASVVVLEREAEAGGIPRHSDHTGYGVRDLRRVMTGPQYARTLTERALGSGIDLRTHSMVTGWDAHGAALVTSPRGRDAIAARAVVLATGARERPRAARLVPGDRPTGVMTTGMLQQLVHLRHESVGTRAVVVGAELVSWSAVMTLREAGCEVVAMTTQHAQPEVYRAVSALGRLRFAVPVARRTRIARINGHGRVASVELEHLDSGARRVLECDTVVFTGDWIPDFELAQLRGAALDSGTRGPVVDAGLRTSVPEMFAVGNVVHPVDTADVAALDGVHVAEQVLAQLAGELPASPGLPIEADPPFRWIAPNLIRPGDVPAPRNRALLWSDANVAFPRIEVRQGDRVLTRRRVPWPVATGRVFRLPWNMFEAVRGDAGPVRVRLV